MKRSLALLLAAALGGCSGMRPAPPEASRVTAPTAWLGTDAAGGAAVDEVDAAWWRQFDDPALSAVVEAALAGNPDIAIAAARVEEARGQFQLAQAQRLPNLVGVAAGGRERSVSAFGDSLQQSAIQTELSVSYDTDLFGRLAAGSAAARAALLASDDARASIRLAVAAAAASGYIGLRTLDARLVILRDTLRARSDSLRLARRRAEAGYASQLDLRQAEAELHATEQLIPAAALAIARQEHALSLLLGRTPGPIERGPDLVQLAAPAIPAGLPSALLRRRPDIAQAEQQLVAADHSLDALRAAFLPNFQITASDGLVASTLLANPIGIFAIGGSILTPILDSGRLRAQQDSAAARRDQAAFAYRRTTLTAFREVEDALAAVRENREQLAAIRAQRESLARLLVVAGNRYHAGYSPYLEQLDAQRALLSAELALVQVQADRLNASVALFQALGGGWQPPPPR